MKLAKTNRKPNDNGIDDDLMNLMNIQSSADLSNFLSTPSKPKQQRNTFSFRQKERGAIKSMRIADSKDFLSMGSVFPILKISETGTEFVKTLLALFLHFEEYYKNKDKQETLFSTHKKDKKEKHEKKEHKEKCEQLRQAIYSTRKQLYSSLQEPFDIILSTNIIVTNHPLYKALTRANDQVKNILEQEKYIDFDMDVYNTGRYSRLVKKKYINHN